MCIRDRYIIKEYKAPIGYHLSNDLRLVWIESGSVKTAYINQINNPWNAQGVWVGVTRNQSYSDWFNSLNWQSTPLNQTIKDSQLVYTVNLPNVVDTQFYYDLDLRLIAGVETNGAIIPGTNSDTKGKFSLFECDSPNITSLDADAMEEMNNCNQTLKDQNATQNANGEIIWNNSVHLEISKSYKVCQTDTPKGYTMLSNCYFITFVIENGEVVPKIYYIGSNNSTASLPKEIIGQNRQTSDAAVCSANSDALSYTAQNNIDQTVTQNNKNVTKRYRSRLGYCPANGSISRNGLVSFDIPNVPKDTSINVNKYLSWTPDRWATNQDANPNSVIHDFVSANRTNIPLKGAVYRLVRMQDNLGYDLDEEAKCSQIAKDALLYGCGDMQTLPHYDEASKTLVNQTTNIGDVIYLDAISNEYGILNFAPLSSGVYRIYEIDAPNGYQINTDIVRYYKITNDGTVTRSNKDGSVWDSRTVIDGSIMQTADGGSFGDVTLKSTLLSGVKENCTYVGSEDCLETTEGTPIPACQDKNSNSRYDDGVDICDNALKSKLTLRQCAPNTSPYGGLDDMVGTEGKDNCLIKAVEDYNQDSISHSISKILNGAYKLDVTQIYLLCFEEPGYGYNFYHPYDRQNITNGCAVIYFPWWQEGKYQAQIEYHYFEDHEKYQTFINDFDQNDYLPVAVKDAQSRLDLEAEPQCANYDSISFPSVNQIKWWENCLHPQKERADIGKEAKGAGNPNAVSSDLFGINGADITIIFAVEKYYEEVQFNKTGEDNKALDNAKFEMLNVNQNSNVFTVDTDYPKNLDGRYDYPLCSDPSSASASASGYCKITSYADAQANNIVSVPNIDGRALVGDGSAQYPYRPAKYNGTVWDNTNIDYLEFADTFGILNSSAVSGDLNLTDTVDQNDIQMINKSKSNAANGNPEDFYSQHKGNTIFALHQGQYIIHETTPPEGYVRSETCRVIQFGDRTTNSYGEVIFKGTNLYYIDAKCVYPANTENQLDRRPISVSIPSGASTVVTNTSYNGWTLAHVQDLHYAETVDGQFLSGEDHGEGASAYFRVHRLDGISDAHLITKDGQPEIDLSLIHI